MYWHGKNLYKTLNRGKTLQPEMISWNQLCVSPNIDYFAEEAQVNLYKCKTRRLDPLYTFYNHKSDSVMKIVVEHFKPKITIIISRFSIKHFKCIITTIENLSLLLVTSDWYTAQ